MDDSFLGNHKTKRALRSGAEALQMWAAMRTYVAVNLTDGFIPDEDIDDLPHSPKNPRKWLRVLVECGKPKDDGSRGPGLIDQVGASWKIHNFEIHGESKETIQARRAANRERQQRFRNAHGERGSNGAPNADRNAVTNASPSHPIPSHPKSDLQATTTQGPESLERASAGRGGGGKPQQQPEPEPADGEQGAPSERGQPPASSGSGVGPYDLQSALAMPLQKRAQAALRDPTGVGAYSRPSEWQEVKAFAEAAAESLGFRVTLGSLSRDAGLRAVVELFAGGYSPGDLRRAASLAKSSEWFAADRGRHRLSAFSPEVVARLFAEAPRPRSAQPKPYQPPPLPPSDPNPPPPLDLGPEPPTRRPLIRGLP